MANMSYRRFENTLRDLRDCYAHMTDPGLSKDETSARQSLVELCADILSECTNVELDYEGDIEVTIYDDDDEGEVVEPEDQDQGDLDCERGA